jgi:flavin reductase (DIM6/NTAB) family NADH-FMN oxidoreductase RutF
VSDYADLELDPRTVLLGGMIEADSAFRAAPQAPPTVDPEAFKAAMRVLASGVVMVTARVGDRLWGLTISACCSISAAPPQVLISLANNASCLPAVLETERFGLSILRRGQRPLAQLGAVPGGPKYVDAFREEREPGLRTTMIAGALAHLDCSVARIFEVSDHTLVIGNVEHAVAPPEDELDDPGPLLYFDRTFYELGSRIA